MPVGRMFLVVVLSVLICCWPGVSGADTEVSLTVSGSVEEIRAILNFIETMKQGSIEFDADDPLKVRVHSMSSSFSSLTGEDSDPEDTLSPPPPTLAITEAIVLPATVAPGEEVLVRVTVVDQDNVVDTLAVTVAGTTYTRDMYDNGRGGDDKAADGVWAVRFMMPADIEAGEHMLAITAYGMSGSPLRVPGDAGNLTTLTIKAPVRVQP